MTVSKRRELSFQSHIVDSYKNCGGYAKKWASAFQVGNPDVIGCLPGVGIHLMEVKHRPDFKPGSVIENPLETKQSSEARNWLRGGGVAMAAVVGASSKAIGSYLLLFHPASDYFVYNEAEALPYVPGRGFYLTDAIKSYIWSLK